jgi:type IV fimbrial biogenesis protein FimT
MAPGHTRGQRGFTLIEAGTTVLILATLATLAIPGFERFIQRRQVDGAAAELATDLQHVRSEAVARNRQMQVSFSTLADSNSCYVVHTGRPNACACEADGRTACQVGAEPIKTVVPSAGRRVSLRTNVRYMLYDPMYGTTSPGATLRVTGADGRAVHVVVNMMGRVSTCSPNAALTGYRAC